jgi:hypothetical protein
MVVQVNKTLKIIALNIRKRKITLKENFMVKLWAGAELGGAQGVHLHTLKLLKLH